MFVNLELEMEMERLRRYILPVLVFTVFVVGQVKAIEDLHKPLSSTSVDKVENLADLLWVSYEIEMKYFKEAYKDMDLGMIATSGRNKLEGDNFLKLLSVLHQQMQPEIVDCLKEKDLVSPISGDDERSSGWYLKLIGSLVFNLYKPAQYRRYLAGIREEPSRKLAQSPTTITYTSSHSRSVAEKNIVSSGSDLASNTQNNSHAAIMVAVVVTAIVTFIFTLLLFVCCHKYLGLDIRHDIKDEKPLLGISTSDYSGGSTNSAVFQSSYHKMSFQSCSSNISEIEVDAPLEGNVESDVVSVATDRVSTLSVEPLNISPKIPSPPLTPPPETVHPPTALPPLKPPPGRAQPLAFEPPVRTGPPPPPPPPSSPRPPSFRAGPPPPGPPPPPGGRSKSGVGPPPLTKGGMQSPSLSIGGTKNSRAKLKPFFWDKVLTDPSRKMVWNQIKAGSFQFNEEMIETLFGCAPLEKNKPAQQKEPPQKAPKFIQLIDSKKAHNLSILMRALNITTEEVRDALEQRNELPPELLETLVKMAPTPEEELKLRLFSGELSQLGPAERFLKVVVDIPFSFKRMEALHFMCSLEDEVRTIKEAFLIQEAAINELKDSRLFQKLLEAVLKTGNRMNDGTFRGGAQAFKLDTLLKLSDVKGVDGKITLLHFVVLEIIRSEGI